MKKLLICLALAFSLVTLGACGKNESAKPTSSTNNHQSKGQGQVTLILKTENCSFKNTLDALDTQILYKKVLLPILGIEDLRNDERIEYLTGKQPIIEIKQQIDSGEFEVAFMMFPSNIEEIKDLADNNLIMPPKSTYIEPKFRSGIVIYDFSDKK